VREPRQCDVLFTNLSKEYNTNQRDSKLHPRDRQREGEGLWRHDQLVEEDERDRDEEVGRDHERDLAELLTVGTRASKCESVRA